MKKKKQMCGHVVSLQGHSQSASKDRHTELFKCPCVFCVYVCGYSYKIVKHPPSPPIWSHKDKYMHRGFGEVTCVWQLYLSVCWCVCERIVHKANDTWYPYNTPPCPFPLFYSQVFFLHLSQTLFSHSPLTSPSLPPFPYPTAFLPLFCRFIFFPLSWHSSREYCWDFWSIQRDSHPCLLFSLFLLSSLPPFIHLSPVNTSYSPFCFFSSITCSPTNLAFLPMVFTSLPPTAPLSSSSLHQFYAWPFACIFLFSSLPFFKLSYTFLSSTQSIILLSPFHSSHVCLLTHALFIHPPSHRLRWE